MTTQTLDQLLATIALKLYVPCERCKGSGLDPRRPVGRRDPCPLCTDGKIWLFRKPCPCQQSRAYDKSSCELCHGTGYAPKPVHDLPEALQKAQWIATLTIDSAGFHWSVWSPDKEEWFDATDKNNMYHALALATVAGLEGKQ